jgi:hypothetical protein
MFGIFKRKNKEDVSKNDLTDGNGKLIKKSSIETNKNGNRFLRLDDDSCAIVLYGDNNVEVIFTKSYNTNQEITENEETLMALALFMKQPGFLEMMISEFRKIASSKISKLTGENSDENN